MSIQQDSTIECFVTEEEIRHTTEQIKAVLSKHRIGINDIRVSIGPAVSTYKVFPAPGVKISRIKSLELEFALKIKKTGIRTVTLTDSVGVEVPNDNRSVVHLISMLESDAFKSSHAELPLAIGYSSIVDSKVIDLAEAPHILLAGATKQGKTVCLNSMVASLLYSKSPDKVKFVFFDPKMIEFSVYEKLFHEYLAVAPRANEEEEKEHAIARAAKDASYVIQALCDELEARYDILFKTGMTCIKEYNNSLREINLRSNYVYQHLPYIVVVIDEFADYVIPDETNTETKKQADKIKAPIIRLVQKGRAVGIHLIIATQRPTKEVITGQIQANIPTRIAFRTTSAEESKRILHTPGAEKLIGGGDLLLEADEGIERFQGAYISREEVYSFVESIVASLSESGKSCGVYDLPKPRSEKGYYYVISSPYYDELFKEAALHVMLTQRASTSDLQRHLEIGFARADRIMTQLEKAGFVGPSENGKSRVVLVTTIEDLNHILEESNKNN